MGWGGSKSDKKSIRAPKKENGTKEAPAKKFNEQPQISSRSFNVKYQPLFDAFKKYNVSDSEKIDNRLSIVLDWENNKQGVLGFMEELHNLTLPKLRKLSIQGMDKLKKSDLKDFEDVMENSTFPEIDILYLHGGGELNMDRFEGWVPTLLKNTNTQIYIDSFLLDQEDIERIFEHSLKTKSLCLINCKVGELEDVRIPSVANYKMESLDLYWTAIQNNDEYLDETKFLELFRPIGKSKLGSSLKKLHVCSEDFDKDWIGDILDNEDLSNIYVDADKKEPKVMQ